MTTPAVQPPAFYIDDDGRHIAFAGPDLLLTAGRHPEELRLWSLSKREVVARRTMPHLLASVLVVAPDGRTALSGDKTGQIFELPSLRKLAVSLKGHKYQIGAAAFSPSGARIATGGGGHVSPPDHMLRVWDPAGVALSRTKVDAETKGVAFVDEGRVLVNTVAGTLALWDTATKRAVWTLAPQDPEVGGLGPFAVAPDREQVYVYDRYFPNTNGSGFRVLDARTGVESARIETSPSFQWGHCNGVQVHPGGAWLVASLGTNGSDDFERHARVQLWDRRAGTRRALLGDAAQTGAVAVAPDGRWVAAPLEDEERIGMWALEEVR